jgi:hypothetical protein
LASFKTTTPDIGGWTDDGHILSSRSGSVRWQTALMVKRKPGGVRCI